jgi:hypothetical protein
MNTPAAKGRDLATNSRLWPAWAWAVFVCAALSCALLALAFSYRSEQSVRTVPDFTLPQVRGGTFHLRAQPSRAVLLAFLQIVPDTADTASRNEVPFLLSMAHQYTPRGLRVVVIDASALVGPPPPTHDALVNASYDWQLDFPVLEDRANQIARRVRVTRAPTLILVAADGRIQGRWQGFTPPAVLAQAIENLFGTASAHGSNLSE